MIKLLFIFLHRIYAEIVHIKSEYCHVLKVETNPQYGFIRDPKRLANFIKTVYGEAKVPPHVVEYVEAFGSGKHYIFKRLLHENVF